MRARGTFLRVLPFQSRTPSRYLTSAQNQRNHTSPWVRQLPSPRKFQQFEIPPTVNNNGECLTENSSNLRISSSRTMLFGTLHVIKSDGKLGSEYPITTNVVFGSDDSVEIKLKVDDVSGRQCQIVPEAATKTLHLEVLDANHATSIDGQRLTSGERKKLENGDIVSVGNRRFKIMYHMPTQDAKTRTPGRSGAAHGSQSAQKKRKSIFDSTPPVPCKPQATPQKESKSEHVTSTTAFSAATPRTPPNLPRTSPRQPKSILSAKKNLLVTRTPTMSPKVVRWGSPQYKSPTSPGTTKSVKQARKSTPALIPRSPIAAARKRSFGTLDEKIKRLAALPHRRGSSMALGLKPETSIVDEVPETPETSRIVADDLSFGTESLKEKAETSVTAVEDREPASAASISPEKERSLARTSTGSSRRSEPIKPSPTDSTPSSSKRASTSNVSSVSSTSSSSRRSRASQSFRISPIATPKPAGVARLSTKSPRISSNRSSISSTSSRKSRQSFRTSPSVSGAEVLCSTMAGSPNVCNSDQPTDSFGSLSVSEVDLSMFDGTLMNDGNDNSTLKERRSSGASSKRRSRVSRSPKAESLMEVDEVEQVAEPALGKIVETPDTNARGNEEVEPVATSSRRSGRLSAASPSTETTDDAPQNESGVATSGATNQENQEPPKKTWAGVLKRSIASGSPFKVNQRKSLKLRTRVTASVAKALRNNLLQRTAEAEIVASFVSTGHALSPQTIYINKKLEAGDSTSTTTPKRDSSLLNKTHDIDLEMFVSPFNTPDNTEALERARDFVKRLPSSRRSTSGNTSSLSMSSIGSPTPTTSRRSTRSSTASDVSAGVAGEESVESDGGVLEVSMNSTGDIALEEEGVSGSEGEVEEGTTDAPIPKRSSKRRSADATPQAVKNIHATPEGPQNPGNNLDCDMKGVRRMLATPKAPRSPENDLEKDIGGVKKMFATPKVTVSPKNELDGSFGGVKKLLLTPKEVVSPKNELDGDFAGVKKLLQTPKETSSPKNELDGNFSGVKKLLRTPKVVISPRNELDGNFSGIKKLLRTPNNVASPKNELDANFTGVKKLLRTPKQMKSPENNLDCDYRGTKRLFETSEASGKCDSRGFNDSVLEGVKELMSPATPKRRSTSPAESKAKRRKATAESNKASEAALQSTDFNEVIREEEIDSRSPMARSRSKRGEKIELLESEKEAESVLSSGTVEARLAKNAAKSESTTSTRGRPTRTKAKKGTESTDDEAHAQALEENLSEITTSQRGRPTRTRAKKRTESTDDYDAHAQPMVESRSELTTDSQNSGEELPEKTEVKHRPTRRKKVEFAEVPEPKTPTTRRGRRAKSTPVKESAGDVSQPSGEESQPSEAESQPSEAESHSLPLRAASRGPRRVAKRKVEGKASHDEEPEVAEVNTPSRSAGRSRRAKTPEIVTDQVPATATVSSAKGRRRAAKPKATLTAKDTDEHENSEPASEGQDTEVAAEMGTKTSAKRGGRKATAKAETVETDRAVKQTKRTRAVKAVKNKRIGVEEAETAPEPESAPGSEIAPEPEVAEPKTKGRKRKVLPTESPVKKIETKKRTKKAESEAPPSTPSMRTTRTRRR